MTALVQPYWIEALFERREGWDEDAYPFNLPAVRSLHALRFHPSVTFLVGENGSGKSTLVEALAAAWGFNPEGGSRDFRFETRASHSPLHRHVRPIRSPLRPRDGFFLRAESFFNLASYQATSSGLERVAYEDTEAYRVTRNFLNRREMMLDVLLAPD